MMEPRQFFGVGTAVLTPITEETAASSGHWLDQLSSTQITTILREAGQTDAMRLLSRAASKASRSRRRAEKMEARAGNEILWRGPVTEPLPVATWRAVARGDTERRRDRTPDVRIADLGTEAIWQGVTLPAGTRLLIDHRVSADGIGGNAEIVQTPTRVRVHIFPARRMILPAFVPATTLPHPTWTQEERMDLAAMYSPMLNIPVTARPEDLE